MTEAPLKRFNFEKDETRGGGTGALPRPRAAAAVVPDRQPGATCSARAAGKPREAGRDQERMSWMIFSAMSMTSRRVLRSRELRSRELRDAGVTLPAAARSLSSCV